MIPIFLQLFFIKGCISNGQSPVCMSFLLETLQGFPSRVKEVLSLQHTSTFLLVD